MKRTFSTREAADKLGVHLVTLQKHVAAKTIRVPPMQRVGGVKVRLWSHEDIENTRTILADIKPGRKPKAKR